MKLSSKKVIDKKMNFTIINKTELQQVKGGKKLHSIKDGGEPD